MATSPWQDFSTWTKVPKPVSTSKPYPRIETNPTPPAKAYYGSQYAPALATSILTTPPTTASMLGTDMTKQNMQQYAAGTSKPAIAGGYSFAGLPPAYLAGLAAFTGLDPSAYYATRAYPPTSAQLENTQYTGEQAIQAAAAATAAAEEAMAKNDYYGFVNTWANKAGVNLTADDWARVWASLNAYRTGDARLNPNRAFTVSDAYNYLGRMLTREPTPPAIAYLRTGEI